MIDAAALASIIYKAVFRFSSEKDLQDGIGELLHKKEIAFDREVSLSPRDRIDFLVGAIGIEVKVASSPNEVQRQLWRYAEDKRVESLILVTTKSGHKSIARDILGKSVIVVHLVNSIFG
jgi:hypothetical protein